jgi:hypothetical protein
MIATTNPPDDEPEPEPVTTPEPTPNLRYSGPENTRHYDCYVDDKFLDIFAHEDRNGALSRIVTEALSQNDNGAQWAPITSWRDWWARAKRAENHEKGVI